MITKTEVLKAITNVEPFAGFATIDNSLAPAISRGDLFALVEAAKCAKYRKILPWGDGSSSDYCLAEDEIPKPKNPHHYEQDEDDD